MTDYQIRVVGNACITRYDRQEGTLDEIMTNSYPKLTPEGRELVKAYVYSVRPDIQ